MFKTFEVKLGAEVHAFVNGVFKVFKAGETFVAHEIGVGEDWVKNHLGHGVKEAPVPAAIENSISAPVVVSASTGLVVTDLAVPGAVPDDGDVKAEADAAVPTSSASGPVSDGVPV